jgi:hypothetical protein
MGAPKNCRNPNQKEITVHNPATIAYLGNDNDRSNLCCSGAATCGSWMAGISFRKI